MKEPHLLAAARRQEVPRTPIWLMRQAGRYLPEYRELRARHDFLALARTPELAAEVTLQPLRRFDLDGAIVFADILLPLDPMGLGLSFEAGEGPRIGRPIRQPGEVARLKDVDAGRDLAFVAETVRLVRRELAPDVPVIGFAGAPFTLASYAVEGGPSRDYRHLKAFMWRHPQAFADLLDRLAMLTISYLASQVAAGAGIVQLFDSWVGALAERDYRRHVLPHSRRVLLAMKELGVPAVHFAPLAPSYLATLKEAGGDVIGIDWRPDIGEVRRALGAGVAVQGNLDPLLLKEGPVAEIRAAATEIVAKAGIFPGHIFNLGHGIDKDTPIDHVEVLIDAVHRAPSPGGIAAS